MQKFKATCTPKPEGASLDFTGEVLSKLAGSPINPGTGMSPRASCRHNLLFVTLPTRPNNRLTKNVPHLTGEEGICEQLKMLAIQEECVVELEQKR
mmetsp:Transcript_19189/g.29669  ORF Transcript_19189/g.29669 Transcript_19189/m.29669 type:complete len:96 (-) Transcript_19189:1816-2103(-)